MMRARSDRRALLGSAAAVLASLAVPVSAQGVPPQNPTEDPAGIEQAETQNEGLQRTARTADTDIGEVGQRQTMRDGPAMQDPLDRIASRINNRVENRIRNRIDRNYDPTANATSPYAVADSQTRAARISGPR